MKQQRTWVPWLAAGALLVMAAIVVVAPRLLFPPLSAAALRGVTNAAQRVELRQAQSQLENNARATLLQGLGGLLVIAGVIATWRQIQVNRDGQITERFTRAIDQLGSDKPDVRIGGIYALERIARNSPTDQPAVTDVLTEFVRSHAPWVTRTPGSPDPHPTASVDMTTPWLRDRAPDAQAALNVLGRRRTAPDDDRLDLGRVDLRRAYLSRAQLPGIVMRNANLARARMRGINLQGARLEYTDLRQAFLEEANLTRAILERAYLDNAELRGASLRDADLTGCSLRNADVRGADLRGAIFDKTDLGNVLADAATIWPDNLDSGFPEGI
jgi:Pentapeptide repeats (8 copies)